MSHEIYETHYLDFYDPVKCIGDLGEKWCNFKWRIYNLQLNPQETFESPVFTTRLLPKTYWYLEVKLSSPGNLRAMKISLRRLHNDENVVSIVDDENVSVVDVIYKVICHEEINISDKSTFAYSNEMPGNDKYYYSVSFYKSKDYVTVECKLRPNKIMIQNVPHGNIDATLSVDLRKLLQSGELCDTIIQVGNQQLMAHFVIICARLPKVLTPTSPTEKGKRIIKINDLPFSVVKEMLKYAYTGQAYVDLDSISGYKDILVKYNKFFFQRCCWEDKPLATTFFNYETDSLLWNLKEVCIKSNLGSNRIELLRLYPSEIGFSLNVLDSEEEEKCLMLTFKFCSEEMPKPTIVSCNYSLVNVESKETFELGETETLLRSNITQGKVKLCSLLEVMRGKSILCAREDVLILKTDFRFCYGSSKSSIENLYEGQFDISQCTSCALLSADMEHLHRFVGFTDIALEIGDGRRISAHKAILIARWAEAKALKVKERCRIVIEDYDFEGLCKFLRQLYTGNRSI